MKTKNMNAIKTSVNATVSKVIVSLLSFLMFFSFVSVPVLAGDVPTPIPSNNEVPVPPTITTTTLAPPQTPPPPPTGTPTPPPPTPTPPTPPTPPPPLPPTPTPTPPRNDRGYPLDLDKYFAADVAAGNAMIQSNQTLSKRYNLNEPWNWDFVRPFDGPTSFDKIETINFAFAKNLPKLQNSITISGFPNLKGIGCDGQGLTTIEMKNLPVLEDINVSGNKLENLDVSNLKNLKIVYARLNNPSSKSKCNFNTINLKGAMKLQKLDLKQSREGPSASINKLIMENGNTVVFKKPATGRVGVEYSPRIFVAGPYKDVRRHGTIEVIYYNKYNMHASPQPGLTGNRAWNFSPKVEFTGWSLGGGYVGFIPKAKHTTVSVSVHSDKTKPSKSTASKVNFPQAALNLVQNKSIVIPAVAYAANNKTEKVAYSSSKPAVATVNAKGKIVAKTTGVTVITAKAGNKKDTLRVTVVTANTKLAKVKGDTPKAMKIGAVKYITPKYYPAKATNVKVTYASNNKNIVSVDATGKLTAKKSGKAIITIRAGGKFAKYTVSVS